MVRIFVLWIMLFVCSFSEVLSSSLVDTYRFQGLNAVEERLEELLQDVKYWDGYLEDKDVKSGYYDMDTPIVFVDKKAKKMKLYRYKNGKISLDFSEDVIVGKEGDKVREGDLKTPVGVYDITRRFIPQDKFYGPVSFELSYPNILDKLESKNGYGIWIHGFPLDGAKREELTRGCVAVENDILVKFDDKLGANRSIVIISEFGDVNVEKKTVSYILASLYQWRDAWKKSDVERYLAFYDERFKRFDGQGIKEFSRMKRQIFSRKEEKVIEFSNLAISPYPDTRQENMFRVAFDELYKTKTYQFKGKKELYVQVKNNIMKILAEK